jgi:hypothetical protein
MAVFFVDWNGLPEGPVTDEPESLEPVVGEAYSPPTYESPPAPYEIPPYEATPIDASEYELPPDETGESREVPSVVEPADFAEAPAVEEIPPVVEAEYDFSQPMGFEPQPMSDPTEPVGGPSSTVSPSLADIADFGNADVTQAAFHYSITIAGIDSAVIYQGLREALTDAKFGWNIGEVMTQIKDGVLTIKSVNAVKASILIQRVKYLPVKVSWRQDVLSSHV